jgi:glycosyltransferase involved in cell wall biosynthesis
MKINRNFPSLKLTIAIPTFNRYEYLKNNIKRILPQISIIDCVELLIIDNASTDNTAEFCKLLSDEGKIKYIRLEENRGMSESQYHCFKRSKGEYLWILSDDDYAESYSVEYVLESVNTNLDLYAFNYTSSMDERISPPIGPDKSQQFNFGYELINHPSVGHMSGLVYKRELAEKKVDELLKIFPITYFNLTRGIYGTVFAALANDSLISSCYKAKPLFCAVEQKSLDYNGLSHLCLLIFTHFRLLKKINIVEDEIFNFQIKLVRARIIKSFLRWYPTLNEKESLYIDYLLTPFFRNNIFNKAIFGITKNIFFKKFLLTLYRLKK